MTSAAPAPDTSPPAGGHEIHMVLSVRLPDRPGGLGAVASRIGALGADITDLTIASRSPSGGTAVDIIHLSLPPSDGIDLVELLHSELSEVDGVSVAGWYAADCCGGDPGDR